MLRRNQLYTGVIDVPEYGVRDRRGDFEPLLTEDTSTECRPCRTGIWSKGRSSY